MKNDILPIGTIVELKNNERFMIIGYNQASDDKGKEYDYICCLPIIGLIREKENIKLNTDYFYINNEDIDKVLYIGYSDEEFKKYKLILSFCKNEKNIIKESPEYSEETLEEHFEEFFNSKLKKNKEVSKNE